MSKSENFKVHFARVLPRYRHMLTSADEMFEKSLGEYKSEVNCKRGCYECCYDVFDIGLIEAMNLNFAFKKLRSAPRDRLIERAKKAHEKIAEVKQKLGYTGLITKHKITKTAGRRRRVRVLCPINERGLCALYDDRPLLCRVYGAPNDAFISCRKNRFSKGKVYKCLPVKDMLKQLLSWERELFKEMTGYNTIMGSQMSIARALLLRFDDQFLLEMAKCLAVDSELRRVPFTR